MRIFSIFFHPERKTVWLGGAEKRFLEFLKFVDRGDIAWKQKQKLLHVAFHSD